uniref:ATPase-like protein n=1 Tax=Micromonospora chalcea TaxID=1874 RepID=B5L6I8_MICCH|nr:ATPase-like protein [Micromonospora chalcea]
MAEWQGIRTGRAFTTTNVGTLGESVRAVVPVRAVDGRIVGLVSVGITTRAINRRLLAQAPVLIAAATPALAVAAAGSWLLSRRLRRQTHGLGPAQMATVDRRVALVNDEARRLLGLTDDAAVVDRPAGQVDLPPAVAELLTSGRDAHDEPVVAGDRVLVVNQRAALFEGHRLGTVLTLRDQTELRTLTSELDSVRALTDALQAQTHESANRLHTVLTLVELGRTDEAVRLATEDLAVAQQLTDRVVGAVRRRWRRCGSARSTPSTSSCSTSGCPTCTGWRCAGRCAPPAARWTCWP